MRNPRVDEYISSLPGWQQAICKTVRELAHQADPAIEETIKRSILPYFVLNGNVCALMATKNHVNIFIYDPIVPDPAHIINQGEGNATARAIQIYENDTINTNALLQLLRAIVTNNKAGGWRALKTQR